MRGTFIMNDQAAFHKPDFKNMTLEKARKAYCFWVDTFWDFSAKAEEYKRNICENIYSVELIDRLAEGALKSGRKYKAKR
tara:strand:+ start:165 stop:404 length:240 start_codon:yes stop_codon:yes gene_type:complete